MQVIHVIFKFLKINRHLKPRKFLVTEWMCRIIHTYIIIRYCFVYTQTNTPFHRGVQIILYFL